MIFNTTVLGLPVSTVDASHMPPQLSAIAPGFAAPALPNTSYFALAAGTGLGNLQSQLSYVQVKLLTSCVTAVVHVSTALRA